MRLLKSIGQTILQLAKQIWLLPQSIAAGVRYWRQQAVPNHAEAERLDRIRNPSKYLGK
jgi:hypothetical protein